MALAVLDEELIKTTTSRCPQCFTRCPAEVWRSAGQVLLRRRCAKHGDIQNVLSSDSRFYWTSVGAGCCGRNDLPATIEQLSTCVALIEIVNSCNLSCPTCFADSPLGIKANVDAVPLEQITKRITGVLERKDKIEILQLSGGEPTLHPQFFELLDWIKREPRIEYLLVNTNGVMLARDDRFLEQLAARVKYDNTQIYLQFDGVQSEGQQELRGADLRELKLEAIRRCAEIKLPMTLAMTVTPDNLSSLWQSIEFGLSHPHIRGITFQPLFGSGRTPTAEQQRARLNVADIIVSCVEGSGGNLRYEDFTPLPCGDPNCATIGYLLKINDKAQSISKYVDFARIQGFLQDRLKYSIEDLARCGCESEPLGALLKQLELDESHTFRILIKPFMDAWSWDEDRIDRCCTHVIRPDGKLDSFCRYYSGFPDVRSAA